MGSFKGVLFLAGAFACATSTWAQQQVAVQTDAQGDKVYLRVDALLLRGDLDTLFTKADGLQQAIEGLSWADVLENGTSPGMDVNFFGYDASGLGNLTTNGTLTGDSLVLNKDAVISGRLNVSDVVTLGDSLLVEGTVRFADSLRVVKAVGIGERLHVTGITALGDSLHVVGNVDLDALLNVDGAATFASSLEVMGVGTFRDTLNVDGPTLLNDSLNVDGNAYFEQDLQVDGNTNLGGTVNISGATTLGSTLSVQGVTSLGDSLLVDGGADFASGVNVDGNTTLNAVRMDGDLDLNGNADISGTLDVHGATTLADSLIVDGVTTLNDTLKVNAPALLNDSLHVVGGAGFAGDVVVGGSTVLNTLSVGGNTSMGGTLAVTGVTSLSDSLLVTGGVDVDGGLNVEGSTTLNTLETSGTTTLQGELTVEAEATFSDTVHFNEPALFGDSVSMGSNAHVAGTLEVSSLVIDGVAIPAFDNTDGLPEGDSNWYYTSAREAALVAQINAADSMNNVLSATLTNLLNQMFDPATVTTQGASAIGADGGTLNAAFDGGGLQLESAGFVLSEDVAFTDSTVYAVASPGASSFSEVVTGLNTAQTYYYKAFVETILNAATGEVVSFQTVGDVAMTTNAATVSGQTTSSITATITDTGGGTVTATGFKYSTASDLSSGTTIAGSANTGTFSANVTGLTRETTYYYAPYSTNEAGTAWGDTLSFTTWNVCDDQTTKNYNGYDYALAAIGEQCWFAENLRSTQFNNGSALPDFANAAYSFPNFDAANLTTYGYLYQQPWNYSTMCPAGWSIPSTAQVNALNTEVSSSGTALKSVAWNGDNASGFNALPAGRLGHPGVTGGNIPIPVGFGSEAYFISSTNNHLFKLDNTSSGFVFETHNPLVMPYAMAAIRCLKN